MVSLGKIHSKDDASQFIEALTQRLKLPLPGKAAQLKMASNVRIKDSGYTYDTASAVRSGVLILLYPADNTLKTVFILRQAYDGVHSGQVSFPGGRLEPQDETLIATALRESHEEVRIVPEKVRVLGTLSELYIPPSNFLVLPVLGYSESRPDFIPDKTEVADLIEAGIGFLFDPVFCKETILDIRGYKILAPYFDVHGHVVWGATAMMLSELREVIGGLA